MENRIKCLLAECLWTLKDHCKECVCVCVFVCVPMWGWGRVGYFKMFKRSSVVKFIEFSSKVYSDEKTDCEGLANRYYRAIPWSLIVQAFFAVPVFECHIVPCAVPANPGSFKFLERYKRHTHFPPQKHSAWT